MDLDKQIKDLEEQQEKLAQKRQYLEEKQKILETLGQKVDKFLEDTNFSSPKELAEALIEKYNIRLSSRKPGQRRKRTTITAELRDQVKMEVRSGKSMNAVSKDMEISYAVVVKIMKGAYDHLQNIPGMSSKAA